MPERILTCVKWGNKFAPKYLNAHYRAAKQHISGPFRFIAITDDPTGLDEGIEVLDLATLRDELPANRITQGKWQKLVLYRQGVMPDDAVVLFLDLDAIITESLDPLFDRVEQSGGHHIVRLLPTWSPEDPQHRFGNSSVVGYIPRQQHQIYERFISEGASTPVKKEQEFQSLHAHDVKHWPANWIDDFKIECAHPFPRSLFQKPSFNDEARVVIFPGAIQPMDLTRGGLYVWGTPARFGIGDVSWIKAYYER